MPQAPLLPPDQMAQQQAAGGLSPANFLMAAADLHSQGQLSSQVPTGKPLQTGKVSRPSRRTPMRVIK